MIEPEDVLYFIRHAESEANLRPGYVNGRTNESPLTAEGEYQARKLGGWLLAHEIIPSAVYVSPAVRTKRTAEIALSEMGLVLPVTFDERLLELDRGIWTGQLRTDIMTPEIEEGMLRLGKNFVSPGGESLNEVGTRMSMAIADMKEPGIKLVFTHGLATRCFAGQIGGWPAYRILREQTPNTSLTRFSKHNGHWQLDRLPNGKQWLGQTPHVTG